MATAALQLSAGEANIETYFSAATLSFNLAYFPLEKSLVTCQLCQKSSIV